VGPTRPPKKTTRVLDYFIEPWTPQSAGRPSESVVESAAHDGRAERDVVVDERAAVEAAIGAAEVDEQILGFGGPACADRDFEPGAHGPAGVCVIDAGEAGG